MLVIGNGEKCPYCDKVMKNFKIDGKNTFQHMIDKHSKEFYDQMFKMAGG